MCIITIPKFNQIDPGNIQDICSKCSNNFEVCQLIRFLFDYRYRNLPLLFLLLILLLLILLLLLLLLLSSVVWIAQRCEKKYGRGTYKDGAKQVGQPLQGFHTQQYKERVVSSGRLASRKH